jgi:uncharacterized protein (TIRG00374 family)
VEQGVKTLLRMALSVAAGVALLALLMLWGGVEPTEIWHTLLSLPPWIFFLCLAIHTVVYVLRALRLLSLVPENQRPTFPAMLAVVAAHNLASYVLPAKSGEATLVIYLKGLCRVSGSAGLATLIVSRLYDFTVMCAMMSVATAGMVATEHWNAPRWLGLAGAAVLATGSVVFLVLGLRGEKLMGPLRLSLRALRLDRTTAGRKLYELSQRASDALRVARGSASIAGLLASSALIWLGVFVFYALLARGFGLPQRIGLPEATFGSGLAVMSNILPVNAFAGFGTQESGWVLGFGILGIEREQAFATGLSVHLVQLFNVCMMGLLGHIAMGILPRRAAAPPPPPADVG